MRVNQYFVKGNNMFVEGIIYDNRALDYCHFVRFDGFGKLIVPLNKLTCRKENNKECIFYK